MDHHALVEELPEIEKLTPQERIALARERRAEQLRQNAAREAQLPMPAQRRPRLRFTPDVALLEATVRGDTQEVERLLMEGVNADSHNEDGLTPLHQCAIDNNERIVRLLLRYGACVNAKDTELWTPLHAAACCAYIDIVRLLIAHNADLLAVNADGNMPYDICDDEQTLDLIESEMAARGITQEMIDERRQQPEREMLNDMKILHQRGLPLDQRNSIDKSTFLHIAAANGYYDVAAFLLRCNVSPALRDIDLWQPIHAAASWNQPDLIELLCEYGADINAKTGAGESPLELTEDEPTQQVIRTIAQTEARRRRGPGGGYFGVRDSRRQSRKRKKFESPQQPPSTLENPFSARGAIRRQSLRDRSGMSLARLEAQREGSDLIRSYNSKEDLSSNPADDSLTAGSSSYLHNPTAATSASSSALHGGNPHQQQRRESPPKRALMARSASHQKQKQQMSPDEWLKKLEADSAGFRDDGEDGELHSELKGGQRGGKGGGGGGVRGQHEMNGGPTATFGVASKQQLAMGSGPNRRRKQGCCSVL
uniref:ANK_REP_REGION domain-containing protein n=1 Tax=Meloidogyne incognita TaxID=6306 RepID=A0A914L9A3_MELIC